MAETRDATPLLDSTMARRTAIAGLGAAAGLAALAACGGKSSSGTPGAAATTTSGGAVAKLADVPVGGSVAASANGKPIVVAQPTAGKVVAFTAICTHQGCTVAPAGVELHCPCHGSVYDAFTGEVKHGPAPRPLAAVPVHVAGTDVVTGTDAGPGPAGDAPAGY